MRIVKKGSVFLLLFLSAGVLFGAGRPLEFDDLLRARRISEPAISPDSRWVAFVETTYDLETCLPLSDIHLVPLAGGEARSLTSGGKGNSRPIFTPDGNSLVFASRRSGTRQFYMLPLTGGGEALQLTAYRAGTGGGVLSVADRSQTAAGKSHSPVDKTVGLFIMMPSHRRRGADQVGRASPEFPVTTAHTPARPSQ